MLLAPTMNNEDPKFIFILNREMENYLNWKAKETSRPKAVIVRDALNKIMKKDKDYVQDIKRCSHCGQEL